MTPYRLEGWFWHDGQHRLPFDIDLTGNDDPIVVLILGRWRKEADAESAAGGVDPVRG